VRDDKSNEKNSRLERIFWSTIVLLALVYIVLQFTATSYIQDSEQDSNSIVPPKVTTMIKEFIVDDDSIKQHLEDNRSIEEINIALDSNLKNINDTIDKSVEKLFAPVYNNIDTFLDFHYSVIGEYTELGLAATGRIEQSIRDRLFGSEFTASLSSATLAIESKFLSELHLHKELIGSYATKDIDRELNSNLLNILRRDINSSIDTQKKKIATMLGIGVSYKVLVATLSTKIAAKLSSKLVMKGAIKGGSKLSAAGIGATTGAVCGPAAIVCSPLFAAVAWFGTDAIIITGDEYLHRDEFREEIIESLIQQKEVLKKQYKKIYTDSFSQESSNIISEYKEIQAKKKIRKKVSDYMRVTPKE